MSRIGSIETVNDGGSETLRGHMETLTLDYAFKMVPTGEPSFSRKPTHRMHIEKAGDVTIDVGAVWTKQRQNNSGHNENYLSLAFDDPSFSEAINAAAFPSGEPGCYEIVWNRRRDRTAA